MATRKWQAVSRDDFVRGWRDGLTYAELCERHGITRDQAIRLRDVFGCEKRIDRKLRRKPLRAKDPSPDEIASCCSTLRMRWTKKEEALRRRWVPEWSVPRCTTHGMSRPKLPSASYSWMHPIDPSQDLPVVVLESLGRSVNYKLIKLAETDESLRCQSLIEE